MSCLDTFMKWLRTDVSEMADRSSVMTSHLLMFRLRTVSALQLIMVLTSVSSDWIPAAGVTSSIKPILTTDCRSVRSGCIASQNSNDPRGSPCCALFLILIPELDRTICCMYF